MYDRAEGRLESQTGNSAEEGERMLEGQELFEKRFRQALIWALRCTNSIGSDWLVEPGAEPAFLAKMVESETFHAITEAFRRVWEDTVEVRPKRGIWEGIDEVNRQLFQLSFAPMMVYEYSRALEGRSESRPNHQMMDEGYKLSKKVRSTVASAIRGERTSYGCWTLIGTSLSLMANDARHSTEPQVDVESTQPLRVLSTHLPKEAAWLEGCLYRHPHDRGDASEYTGWTKTGEFTPAHMQAMAAWLLPMIQMRGCIAKGADGYMDKDGESLLHLFERRYKLRKAHFEDEMLEAQAEGERLFQKDLASYKELAEGYKKDWRLLKNIDQRSTVLAQELSELDAQIQNSKAALLAYEAFINEDINALDQTDLARYPEYDRLLSTSERPFRGSVEEVASRHRFEFLASIPKRGQGTIDSNSSTLRDLLRKRALLIDRHNHWSTFRKDRAKKELEALDEQIENTRSAMNANLDEKRENYMHTWREAEFAEESLPFYTMQRKMAHEAFENCEEVKTELRVRLEALRKTLNEFLDRAGYVLIPAELDLSQPLSPALELVRRPPPSWNGYD